MSKRQEDQEVLVSQKPGVESAPTKWQMLEVRQGEGWDVY